MPVYAKKVSTTSRRFSGRVNVVAGWGPSGATIARIPVEDTVVL